MCKLVVRCRRWVAGVSILAVVAAWSSSPAWGQEGSPAAEGGKPTVTEASQTAESATAPTARKTRGRLPAYYGEVVDEKQREAIYGIQGEYAPRIAELQAQLSALTSERDKKVAAVLTPQQLQKVEQLRAAAKAKRDEAKEANSL